VEDPYLKKKKRRPLQQKPCKLQIAMVDNESTQAPRVWTAQCTGMTKQPKELIVQAVTQCPQLTAIQRQLTRTRYFASAVPNSIIDSTAVEMESRSCYCMQHAWWEAEAAEFSLIFPLYSAGPGRGAKRRAHPSVSCLLLRAHAASGPSRTDSA
jgi:hypothetical protein